VTFTLPQGSYRFRADYEGVQFWSGPTNACQLPGCETAAVTLPGGVGQTNATINYQYDALHRLKSASYSNGIAFQYTYDAAGNVLNYQRTVGGGTITTTYTYNAGNELVTAQASDTNVVWNYSYDGNGSLIQSVPGGSPANGASRYTYNTAGYLVKVESYGDSGWNTQAEMAYDGLGESLSMTAYAGGQSVTTHYALDNGQVLTAAAADLTTTYLYGLGPIAELTDSWAYGLPDGTSTQRQLVDSNGTITLLSSYTPWGDTLSINGKGNFTFGYFGGIMDTATGLLYIGNGQYYDPSTGRFLTRGVNPGSTNPYVPWKADPASVLFAPLALLAMVYSRKKGKRSKWDYLIILLVLAIVIGVSLVACGSGTPTPTPSGSPTPTMPPNSGTQGSGGNTSGGSSPSPEATPSGTPTKCTATTNPTPTPPSTIEGLIGWLYENPIQTLTVPIISQLARSQYPSYPLYYDLYKDYTCGEASIYMARAWAIGGDLSDGGILLDTIVNTALGDKGTPDAQGNYAQTAHWFTPSPPYTSPANMVNLAVFYSPNHIPPESGHVNISDDGSDGLNLLIKYLTSPTPDPVIVDVTSKLSPADGTNAHFVVTGLSSDGTNITVNYNDPAFGEEKMADYVTSFWPVWKYNRDWSEGYPHDGNGWWLVMH
jgi:RHS repeat-associated protein